MLMGTLFILKWSYVNNYRKNNSIVPVPAPYYSLILLLFPGVSLIILLILSYIY